MADLPEYQKHVAIQPTAQPLGFSQALTEQATASNFIGEVGAQFAQRASNERARIAGLEAGKTPGRLLLPPIGESDAEFQKAYKGQEYAIAMTNGNAALNNLAATAKKNLSSHGLLTYDATAYDQIDNITKDLTPENANIVRTELKNQYLNQRSKLSEAVYAQGKDLQRDQFKANFDTYAQQLQDSVANDNVESARNATNVFLDKIDKGEYNSIFNEHERTQIKHAIIENLDLAIKRKDARSIIAKGKMEAVLKERATLPPTAQNLQTTEVYANEYKIHQQLVGAYDDLKITQAKTKVNNGTFNPVDGIVLKSEVSPLAYAKFELDTSKIMAAQKEQENLYNFFDANKKNAIALSTLSGGELDKAFAQKMKNHALETGLSDIFAEAQVAKDFDVAIPSVNKKIVAGINSTNPQASIAASNIYKSLVRDHPNAVSGVDSKSALKAEMIVDNGSNNEAWKYASDKLDNLTPAQLAENETLFNAELQAKELKNPLAQRALIASRMGFSVKDMPPGLQTDYMKKLKKNYVISKDWDKANKVAVDELKRVWRETEINGFKEVMWMPPDLSVDPGMIKESILEDVNTLFTAQQKEFDHPESTTPFYFKIIKSPQEEALANAGLEYVEGKQIHVAKVDLGGAEIPGILVVRSDADTAYPEPGKPPSYSMQFLPDGKDVFQLVYEPNNWSNARFYLPYEKLLRQQTEDEQRRETKKLELEAQAVLDLSRKRTIEGLFGIGEQPKKIAEDERGFYG